MIETRTKVLGLPSGGRCRRFESSHSDQLHDNIVHPVPFWVLPESVRPYSFLQICPLGQEASALAGYAERRFMKHPEASKSDGTT